MVEIMGRFPKVEDLVTVLDRGIEGCNAIGYEKDVESYVQREVEGRWRRAALSRY